MPVILDKESILIVRHAAARTADEADKGDYEYDVNLDFIVWPNEIKKPHFGRKPTGRFIVLEPGRIWETESMVAVAVRRAGIRDIAGTVPPGDHFLQVEVATWFHGDAPIASIQERWSKYGYLYREEVFSRPMAFHVKEPSKLKRCD